MGNIRSDNTVELFGKKVYALGADNKKHVSRIQGAPFEYVYGDEITTCSQEVFEDVYKRQSPYCADFTESDQSCEHWEEKHEA